jgi:hypothetical protein
MSWHFCSSVGGGGMVAGGQVAPGVAEDPGHGQRAAADHDAGAFRDVDHALGVVRGADVAVADDGDAFHGGDDLGDAVEAGLAGERISVVRPWMVISSTPASSSRRAR